MGFSYGNGVQASFGYNSRLELATLRYYTGSGDLLNLTYGYALGSANNGQIQTITDNLDATKSLSYTYDALSRLQYATAGPTGSPTWKLGFVYDRYGNRTNENLLAGSGPSGVWAPDPTTNRLPLPYQYDAAGNMTNDSFNTYVFDGANRITQVTTVGATYSYDGNGLRVQKAAGGTTTTYIFSGTKVIAEYVGGALSKEYIYAGSQLLATVDVSTGNTSYQHPDHLSTRVETGAVTRTFGHYPFGEPWYETGTAGKWKFTSYERDSESNLDYAMARHYSNVAARFLQPDPLGGSLGNPQNLNRYAYVNNDPITNVDPLGLLIYTGPCRNQETGGPCEMWDDAFGLNPFMCYAVSIDSFATGFTTCGFRPISDGGDGGNIRKAKQIAKRLFNVKDCLNFLQSVLNNLPGLSDAGRQVSGVADELDRSTVVETPSPDPDAAAGTKPAWPTTAHVSGGVGASSVIHVDVPNAWDLPQTLIHEVFHGVKYGFTDAELAAAAGRPVSPNAKDPAREGSKNFSDEMNKHCNPQEVK